MLRKAPFIDSNPLLSRFSFFLSLFLWSLVFCTFMLWHSLALHLRKRCKLLQVMQSSQKLRSSFFQNQLVFGRRFQKEKKYFSEKLKIYDSKCRWKKLYSITCKNAFISAINKELLCLVSKSVLYSRNKSFGTLSD